jgi:hypothetical protein
MPVHDRPRDIAILYLATSFGFLVIVGAMALLMRAEVGFADDIVPLRIGAPPTSPSRCSAPSPTGCSASAT